MLRRSAPQHDSRWTLTRNKSYQIPMSRSDVLTRSGHGACAILRAVEKAISSEVSRQVDESPPEKAQLTLEEMGPLGDTLAQFEGERINVFGGIPGEEVVARIVRYRRGRRRLCSAIVSRVVKPSPHRVAPPCPYFGPCTGCQWQHIEYPYQLLLKREAVLRELKGSTELEDVHVAETMPSPEPLGYRNHARFTVRGNGSVGYVNRITRRFVSVDHCMLMSQWINETLGKLQGRSGETSQISVRHSVNTGEWLIQPSLGSDEIPVASGQTYYHEKLLGSVFRIGSPSFFQVNTAQAERLSLLVRKRLDIGGGETLVDAYAGVGTFAALFAPFAKRVIAIEESEAAIKDAAINTASFGNLEIRQGRTESVLGALDSRPDAVVLDPPRAGCQPAALDALLRWRPRRTVYVSCDPGTLARDLRILVGGGLRLESVEPVDMFPQTHHVECVATLSSGD